LRPEPPLVENPRIKCAFGWDFRVSKPYLYDVLTREFEPFDAILSALDEFT
jgi:hypothetical protein